VAKPSGNPPGPPHATRSATHYACRRRLNSPAITPTRLLRAPFHFVHTAGVLRTRNVSEYMLVLALCLVSHSCRLPRQRASVILTLTRAAIGLVTSFASFINTDRAVDLPRDQKSPSPQSTTRGVWDGGRYSPAESRGGAPAGVGSEAPRS